MINHLINAQDQTPVSHFGYETEAEYVNLPSQGFFYTNKNKTLKIRKLNWLDENILTTKSYYDNNIIIKEILNNIIVDPTFIIDELVPIDVETILIWSKLSTFGRAHTVPFKCKNKPEGEECNHVVNATWDLGELEVSDYPEEYEDELKDFGHITYYYKEIAFNLTVPSFKRQAEVKYYLSNLNAGESFKNTEKLLTVIKSIYVEDRVIYEIKEIHEFLLKNRLSLQESRNLIKEAERINLKTESNQAIVCPGCGITHSVRLIVDQNFFGLNSMKYKEYLVRSLNFLDFWGKIDYQSILHMPTYRRKMMIELTRENLETLYGKKK